MSPSPREQRHLLSLDELRTLMMQPRVLKDVRLANAVYSALRYGEALKEYASGETPPYDEEKGAGWTARHALGLVKGPLL